MEVSVIGVGALGSTIVMMLSQLRFSGKINIYDNDIVELKNTWNQVYLKSDETHVKVEALKFRIQEKLIAFPDICCNNMRIENLEDLGELEGSKFLFLCVDNMKTRRFVMENINNIFSIEWVIELRMDDNSGTIFTIPNRNSAFIEKWRSYSKHEDVEKKIDVCGGDIMAVNTVTMAASIAVNNYLTIKSGFIDSIGHKISFTSIPFTMISKSFLNNNVSCI